ncbi:MAG: AraC-like DNA-binding protein [Planctomycetota bacterium]
MRPHPQRYALSPWARARAFRDHPTVADGHGLHYHPEVELVYVEAGGGDVYFGNEIHRYEAGDIVVIEEGVEHDFLAEPGICGANVLVLQFSPDALNGFDIERANPLRKNGALGMIYRGRGARQSHELFEDAIGNWSESETPSDGLRLRASVLKLLAELGEMEPKTIARSRSTPPVVDEKRGLLELVLERIHESHQNSVRLEDIAKVAGMRSESFCRFFKRHMGLTFTQYLNEVRLESAARLLASSGRKVLEIGAEAGYSNLSYFNRRFRQRFGLTPQEFRRKHQAR